MSGDPMDHEQVRTFVARLNEVCTATSLWLDPDDGGLYHHGELVGYLVSSSSGEGYGVATSPGGHAHSPDPYSSPHWRGVGVSRVRTNDLVYRSPGSGRRRGR